MTTSGNPPVENESSLEPTTLELRAKALREVRVRTALFNGLLSEDLVERSNALNKITQIVKTWAKECYPPEPEGSTAGTVGSGRENVSGVSSPIYNRNSSQRSSISDGNNTFNSPLFTDGSASVSASSYNVSPVVDSGFDTTAPYDNVPAPFARFAKHNNGNVDYDDDVNSNTKELKRGESLDGGDSSRRNSTDESIDDNSGKSKEESLRLSILTMLRMSIDCPFADVRHSFHKCLSRLRTMNVPVPAPICTHPSSYIAPEETITLSWPSEYAGNPLPQNIPRSITPSGRSSSCSSSSSYNSSSFSEEIPRIIQQPLTPSTPLFPTSPPSFSVGKQPDELVKKLIVDTFTRLGRLSHFYRVLAYFPSFMEKYQNSYDIIVRNPNCGPLPIPWRFYIGMMAASQHKCQYAVSKLTDDFILCGGDISWLQGLDHAPAKLRKLATLNTILAHQPWRLNPSHIGALAKGSENPQDNWTISEIVHAIVILSTYHGLSSYVLGCGIVPEYDSIGGNYDPPPNVEDSGTFGISENISPDIAFGLGVSLNQDQPQESESDKINDKTMKFSKPIDIQKKFSSTPKQPDETDCAIKHTNQLIKRLKDKREIELSTSHDDGKQINYGSTPSEITKTDFENVDEETFDDSPDDPSSPFPFLEDFFSSSHNDPHILTFNPPTANEYYSRFLDKSVEIRYEEFIVNSPEYNVLKLGDYCWESEGVVMVNRFLSTGNDSPGVGELLDREFAEIQDFTDYSLFHSYQSPNMIDLDTTPLRRAIWHYVLRLFGILKEDYEYKDIKTFLNRKIKEFLKKISCRPEEIGYKDWRNIGFHLREEEKCHVNLIAVEARKQAELIYGLSCVMKYEKERF